MIISKTKILEKLLFPLFLVNITTSANTWNILGISIGQFIFYFIIIIATYIIINTQYKILSYALVILSLFFHLTNIFSEIYLLDGLKTISLGGIFFIVCSKI